MLHTMRLQHSLPRARWAGRTWLCRAAAVQAHTRRAPVAAALAPSRWCGQTASSGPSEPAGDPVLRSVLIAEGAAAAAQDAFKRFGRYSKNEVAWQRAARQLLDEGSFAEMGLGDVKSLVRVLAEDVGLTQASFWEAMTGRVAPALESAELEDLMELAEQYTGIQAFSNDCIIVFQATIKKVRRDMAIHTMQPRSLTQLLSTFGRAGAASKSLSRITAQLFNEMEDRVLSEVEDFEVEDCIALIGSMAKFRATKVPVLQHLGREVLHARLLEQPGPQVSAVCHAYGQLGWRHDTVFRDVATEILEEHEGVQRARVLGQASVGKLKYSASDVAFVALAMLRLKMYRGNTSWYRWGDNYQELLDVLARRMEDELPRMHARPLAAAAFVLGRARRGTEELYKAMYERMMQLLDERDAQKAREPEYGAEEPPQDDLPQFLHGLAMMGPTRKKDLDTQWLMQWLSKHVYTFVLSDFILVNRHLVAMQCYDKEYLQMLVPFYVEEERCRQLQKSDIMELTNTYNGARIREDDVPDGLGRHFFWRLGRQYQRLHVDHLGARRAPLRRIG